MLLASANGTLIASNTTRIFALEAADTAQDARIEPSFPASIVFLELCARSVSFEPEHKTLCSFRVN